VAAKASERTKLEHLCRYITRPAISEKRLSLTEHGQIRYSLKNPWRDGTTPPPQVTTKQPQHKPPIPLKFIEYRFHTSYTLLMR
jgi:hypothetical protein